MICRQTTWEVLWITLDKELIMDDLLEIKQLLLENTAKLDAFCESVSNLTKKVDKMVSLNTKIAKSLHLLPVTEKEERELQLLQRKNLQLAAKVNEDLAAMEPPSETMSQLSVGNLSISGVFSDTLGDDFLSGIVR